jgi:hypothetical protein
MLNKRQFITGLLATPVIAPTLDVESVLNFFVEEPVVEEYFPITSGFAYPNLSEIVTTTLRNRTGQLAASVTRSNALLLRLSNYET